MKIERERDGERWMIKTDPSIDRSLAWLLRLGVVALGTFLATLAPVNFLDLLRALESSLI